MKMYLSSGGEVDITTNDTGGVDVNVVCSPKTFNNIQDSLKDLYDMVYGALVGLNGEGIFNTGMFILNSLEQSVGVKGKKVAKHVGPPPITGNESDGDVSPDGNYVFECGDPSKNTKDRWVTTEKWLRDKYKTSPYRGAPYYQRDYVDYLKSGEYAKYLQKEFSKLGKQFGVSGYELYIIVMGEGLGLLLDEAAKYNLDLEKIEVDGFVYAGTDNFYDEANKLKQKGLLPKDFKEGAQYALAKHINEAHEQVNSAQFAGISNALTAFAATYMNRRLQVVEDGKKLGYDEPTEDQIRFWTYIYYNPGREESGYEQLRKNGSFDYTNMKFDRTDPHPKGVRSKAYKRVATEKYLEEKGTGLIK